MDLKAYLADQFTSWSQTYLNDLRALPESALGAPFAAEARTPFDMTCELSLVNRRIAGRLKGQDPGAWPEGWVAAPESLQSLEAAAADFEASCRELASAWEEAGAESLLVKGSLAGTESSPFELMHFVVIHMGYHDAQLNYIQELHGDMAVHWSN